MNQIISILMIIMHAVIFACEVHVRVVFVVFDVCIFPSTGLATHELHFTIIREEFKPNQKRPCEICGQIGINYRFALDL